MASIRKSFSFRNGVQVDEDNFIVNANGLVGIGTSIPGEALDVRGTAKVVGLTTTNDLFVSGVATATDIKVGTAISITDGGIKATNFYGDGATLSNLPTSQWKDVDVGLGFTSIHAVGNVGIATTDPRSSFQVGGTPGVAGKRGVGINSIGNIQATGIVTATSFVGALTGNVVGNVTGTVTGNVTGNITGNVDGNINSTGVSTFTDNVTFTGASGNVSFIKSDNSLNFGDNVKAKFGIGVGGDAEIFHDASTGINDLRIIDKVGNLKLETASNKDVVLRTGVTTQTNLKAVATQGVELYFAGSKKFETSNTGAVVTGILTATETSMSEKITVGTGGTALAALNTGQVGIGSAIPKSDLTIRKTSDASLEIVGESGQTKVSLGKSDTDGNESALIRYGNPDGSLNFVNYNPGSVNTFIHAGTSTGIQTGRFSWIYGQSNAELLSLTHEGKVGVGKTNPDFNLEVVGTSTVTSGLGVGGDLDVAGDINLTGSITLPSIIDGSNININSGISTFNNVAFGGTTGHDGNVFAETATGFYNAIGVQTMTVPDTFNMRVVGKSQFDFIGIGTTASPDNFFNQTSVTTSGSLHIYNASVGLNSCSVQFDQGDIAIMPNATVGIGSTMPKSAVDFKLAGSIGLNTVGRFLIPPTVNTDEKVGLQTIAGGIVYDSTLNKLQCFNGTTWNNLF